MPDYVYVDDALAPKGVILIEYYGKNPLIVYSPIRGLLQTIFEVKGKDIFEDKFKYDISADPCTFYVKMHVEKKFDKYTRAEVTILMYGTQPVDLNDPKGKLVVEISGWLRTKYPYTSPFQRFILMPFILLYHYALYNSTRRKYLRILRRSIERLEGHFRTTLRLPMRESLEEGVVGV